MSHLSIDELEAAAAHGQTPEHVNACEACRTQYQRTVGRRRLLSGLKPYTLSDMAFRRVEAAVVEAAERPRSGFAWWWLAVPAALALVAIVAWPRSAGEAQGIDTSLSRVSVPLPRGGQFALTVISTPVDARVKTDTRDWSPLQVADVVSRQSQVQAADLELAPLEAPWGLRLQGVGSTEGAPSFTLAAGTLTAEVTEQTADVMAGRIHVATADASFLVTRAAAETIIEVTRGEVVVTDGSAVRRLAAPVRMRWADETPLWAGQPLSPEHPATPTARRAPWVRVSAPAGAGITGLDGAHLGHPTADLLLAAGPHQLTLRQGTLEQPVSLDLLLGQPLVLKPLADAADAAPPSADALKRLSREIAQQTPRLAACYEKWLKANAGSSGNMTLGLSIAPTGRVTSAQVSEAPSDLPAAVRECLTLAARRLSLSAPGTPTELAVPLVLRPRGR